VSRRTRPGGEGGVDHAVEILSRWLAARTSRRGFLGRMARVAVLVATGPTLVTLLARRADARVCGQSGVTPKCPTFDCDGPGDVWGWCWYASPGCCANGGLKKICDCCTRDWPNVHGYCPSGTNVRCIMESCHSDPRLMGVGLSRVEGDDAATVAAGLARRILGDTVWLAGDDLRAAVLAPLAAAHGQALLVTGDARLAPAAIRELQRRQATTVVTIDGAVGAGALDEARRYVTVEVRSLAAGEAATWSARVGRLVEEMTGANRIVAVDGTGASAALAPPAAALAAKAGMPLLVGRAAVAARHAAGRPPLVTWLVGPETRAWQSDFAGAKSVGLSASSAEATRDAAEHIVTAERLDGLHLVVAPATATGLHAGLAGAVGAVLFHADGRMDESTLAWVRRNQSRLSSATKAGSSGGFGSEGVWELQSALNRFDTHVLQGVSGQGLPVISQPRDEREIGRARIAGFGGAPPREAAYWSSRANPARRD
jgi:hypothetical protein